MKEVENKSPVFLGCRFDRWRNIRCPVSLQWLEVVGKWGVFLAWFYYAWFEKAFWGLLTDGRALLVDLLLGVPLVLAMGLVGMIVWMGLVRWLCCVSGWGQVVEDEVSDAS